jgi:hypothetical protein
MRNLVENRVGGHSVQAKQNLNVNILTPGERIWRTFRKSLEKYYAKVFLIIGEAHALFEEGVRALMQKRMQA